MIKAKESQGLFDYSCKQTYQLINGKFMNNENIHLDPALRCLDYCGFQNLTKAELLQKDIFFLIHSFARDV